MSWDMESVYDDESAAERAGTLGYESRASERHLQVMGVLNAIHDELETLNAQFREAFPPPKAAASVEVEIPISDETAESDGSPIMAGNIRRALREAHDEGFVAVESDKLLELVKPSKPELFWVTLENLVKAGIISSNNNGEEEPTIVAYFLPDEAPKTALETLIMDELRLAERTGETPIKHGRLFAKIKDEYPDLVNFGETLWRLARHKKVVWHSPSLYEQSSYSMPKEEA